MSQILSENILRKYKASKSLFNRKYLCKAPYTSMRFGFNGNVYSCCYNKSHILGSYPGETIENIWNGVSHKNLENAIQKNDLSMGCQICREQLENNEFHTLNARQFDQYKIKDFPTLLEFELDNTCNLACIMCNEHASSIIQKEKGITNSRKTPYDKEFLVQLEPFLKNITYANFIGGEPFLIDLYYKIWELLLTVNKKVRINISTNGTILNEKIKHLLAKGRFDISVSIDSIKKESYEKIRKNAKYDVTLQNMEFFQNYCKTKGTSFTVWICPMTVNAYEIPEFVKYFSHKKVHVYFNTVTMPHSLSISYLGSQEIRQIHSHYSKNSRDIDKHNLIRYNGLKEQLQTWANNAEQREHTEKEFEGLNTDSLLEKYLASVDLFIKEKCLSPELKYQISEKINSVTRNKSNGVTMKIFKFVISLPVEKSIQLISSNNTEAIENYITKNFNE